MGDMKDVNQAIKTGDEATAETLASAPVAGRQTTAELSAPVIETVNLSDERKKEIESVANEYFEKIKKIAASETNDNLLTDLLKVLNILEKTSDKTDFLSAYFLEVGTLIQKSADSYDQKVELYLHSPLIKLFIREKCSSARQQILLYFKEVITGKAKKALPKTTSRNSNLIETFRLMQLAYLCSDPVKQFASNYQGISTFTDFIIDTYWVDTSTEDYVTKLARFDKYFNKQGK